ncbi:hypothetical protein [Acinetobacter sp. TWP2-2-3]|jgi:hypothetical protein|uniref:hypothetical protein n=1 Tax=unclassified Acinetobacter TaxID=196816 RepID=UPI003CFB0173
MNQNLIKWIKENIGSCLSWAITIGWLIFIYFKIHNGVLPKDLNEFGDFIAGAFAPLAFFWLVRGFYQQGKGLEQNSEALKMQAVELQKTSTALNLQIKEMQETVEQQKLLAEYQRLDIEDKHQSVKPILTITCTVEAQSYKHCLDFRISNATDNPAKNLTLFPDLEKDLDYAPIIKPYFEKKYIHITDVLSETEEELFDQGAVCVRNILLTYENIYSRKFSEKFKITLRKDVDSKILTEVCIVE